MINVPVTLGTFTASLAILFEKGVRYSTVIDVGCADGNFALTHCYLGMFANAKPLNIDANAVYEHSLKAIKEVIGGDYVIAAVADKPGEREMTVAAHPYWNSLRGEGDLYWERILQTPGLPAKIKVPVVTLDGLTERLNLPGPYLVKLDIQGAEAEALEGAKRVLEDTEAVICEADVADFPAINRALESAGFSLFDVTNLVRTVDHSLAWFYPIYLNRRLDSIRRRPFWTPETHVQTIELQIKRRNQILEQNAKMLDELRLGRKSVP